MMDSFNFKIREKKIKLVFYKLNYDYLITTIDTDNPNSKIYLKFKSINLRKLKLVIKITSEATS